MSASYSQLGFYQSSYLTADQCSRICSLLFSSLTLRRERGSSNKWTIELRSRQGHFCTFGKMNSVVERKKLPLLLGRTNQRTMVGWLKRDFPALLLLFFFFFSAKKKKKLFGAVKTQKRGKRCKTFFRKKTKKKKRRNVLLSSD